MTMGFDINKPYRTRDFGEAWALRLPEPMKGSFIYVGAYRHSDGRIYSASWAADGRWNPINEYSRDGCDLVNIPEKRTVKVWINVYEGDTSAQNMIPYPSRDDADKQAIRSLRLACIEREITYEVGEGL